MQVKFTFRMFLLCVALFGGMVTNAQTVVELQIIHKLGGTTPFAFSTTSTNDLGNGFNVTRIEYYLSKISITHDGGTVTAVPDMYLLANGSATLVQNLGSYSITNVESISFYVGVDTPNNHADPSLQPSGHALAPKSPSMHWGWAAGYRFVAMEGKSGTSLSQSYELHALGDNYYHKVTVPVTGVVVGTKIVVAVNADYAKALKGIDVSPGLIEHGELTNDIKLLGNFRDHVFSAGTPVSVTSTAGSNHNFVIYPNPSATGDVVVSFDGYKPAATVVVSDIAGRQVTSVEKAAGSEVAKLHIATPGMYMVTIILADGTYATQKLTVE